MRNQYHFCYLNFFHMQLDILNQKSYFMRIQPDMKVSGNSEGKMMN